MIQEFCPEIIGIYFQSVFIFRDSPPRSNDLISDDAVSLLLHLPWIYIEQTAFPARRQSEDTSKAAWDDRYWSVIERMNEASHLDVKFILISMSCGHAYCNSLPHHSPTPVFSGSLMKSLSRLQMLRGSFDCLIAPLSRPSRPVWNAVM